MARFYLFCSYLVSGVTLGLATFVAVGWQLTIIGLLILFWAVKHTWRFRDLILGSVLTFLTKSLIVTLIFSSIYPLDWLPVSSSVALILVLSYWFYSAIGATIGGVLMIISWRFIIKFKAFWQLLWLPVSWLAGELFGAYLYSILMATSSVDKVLAPSAGFIGHNAVNHSGLFLTAKWGGVFLLSVLLVGLATGLMLIGNTLKGKHRWWGVSLAILLVFMTSYLPWGQETNKYLPKIAIVETDFVTDFMTPLAPEERSARLFAAVSEALALEPTYIVLPEDARFMSETLSPNQALAFYQLAFSGPTSWLVDSSRVSHLGGVYLRASLYDPVGRMVWQTDKQSLIPLGEYLPTALSLLLKLIKAEEEQKLAMARLSYQAGPLSDQSLFPINAPGVLFCFESLDPSLARSLAKAREVPFFVHLVSHAWFNDDYLLRRLTQAALLTQARYSGVPIVSVANASVSAVYWPNGQREIPPVVAEGESWRVRLLGTDVR